MDANREYTRGRQSGAIKGENGLADDCNKYLAIFFSFYLGERGDFLPYGLLGSFCLMLPVGLLRGLHSELADTFPHIDKAVWYEV